MAQIIPSWNWGWGWSWASYSAWTWIEISAQNEISVDTDVVQTVGNMVTSLTWADDDHYPTAKAVADAITGWGNGDVMWPNSSTDWDIVLFDWATGKKLKDSWKKPSDYQEKLTTQTAYTAKGTSSKVPTITTNTLWQVTSITETSITFPVTSVNWSTWAVTWLQTTANLKTSLSDNSDSYYPSQKAVKTAVDDKQDKATSWSWAPSSTPTFIWQEYIDTTNNKMYFASWTSSSSDWTLVGSWSWMWDVTWPASSTDSDIVLFDWTTWKVIKDWNKKLADLVQTSWNQTIAWTKTFSTSPVVPSKTTAAGNTWTAIATEAQVYLKQDKLTAQTAYTSKWGASKVPQITTNSLWQVTWITEVNISYPSQVSDIAYASSWDGVTGTAPSKNAVYDKISAMDTTISWKQDALSTQTAYTTKGTATKVPTITTNTLWQVTAISETNIAFPVTSVNGQTGDVSVWDIKYSDFDMNTASSWATLTISNLTTQFTPNQNFTLASGTVKVWMQYIVRINSGATVHTITLWVWVTNPFNEDLTLTANKKTTIILLATSTSTLEIFGVRTED